MTTPTVKFSTDGLIALTQTELDYLQTYIDAGDRGGFYAAYYNITGNSQALEQLQIATFSEGLGGTAYVANYALQRLYGQSRYEGIYFLSQEVAVSAFSVINESATISGSGYINPNALFLSAQAAWVNRNVGNLFPGNLLSGIFNTTKWIQDNVSTTAILPFTAVIRAVADALNNITADARTTDAGYQAFTNTLLTTGAGVGFLASIGSIALGKRRSDYAEGNYSSVALPDGKLILTFDNQNNRLAAGFDNGGIPIENFQYLNLLSRAAALTIGLPFTAAAEFVPFLRAWLTQYRQHLSEWQSPNGDFGGLVNTYLYNQSPYITTATGTSGSDSLWGTSPTLRLFGGNDNLDAGAADDSVFAGGGNDIARGGDGNDILYGQEGDDALFGDAGADILRGGVGEDTLCSDDYDLEGTPAIYHGQDHLDEGSQAERLSAALPAKKSATLTPRRKRQQRRWRHFQARRQAARMNITDYKFLEI